MARGRSLLEDKLGQCKVMLAIIGPNWVDARDARRLDNPEDWVRLEIERALARKIPVIPVLVAGATLSSKSDLTPSLQPLVGIRPVINVNWEDATAYASWLSRKTGKIYRLLSEAEREYVTRAGATTPFWWGSSITPKQANYNGSIAYGGGLRGEYVEKTVLVDSFEANAWGLFNVNGNVWEWTEDCWDDSNRGNPGNGIARMTGDCLRRVVRGDSWNSFPQNLRAAKRTGSTTVERFNIIGFRLARTINP
jgi:formylglycine-generating enzyme required for sulfatase activity